MDEMMMIMLLQAIDQSKEGNQSQAQENFFVKCLLFQEYFSCFR
jgi:hypothetical protein